METKFLSLYVCCCLLLLFLQSSISQSEGIREEREGGNRANKIDADILDFAGKGDLQGVVDSLSANPSSVQYRNERGFTPLILAASNGHKEVVDHLLTNGADVNQVENDHWSPLMFVAWKGFTEIAVNLLAAGANPLMETIHGDTAHELAIRRNHPETAKVIGEESVLYALVYDLLDDTLRHIRLGVSPNIQNIVGWTPLMLAATHGSVDAVAELLRLGAEVNVQENDGWTAIIFAAHFGFSEVAELLIRAGADLNHVTKKKKTTAWKEAKSRGHDEMVLFLENNGAHPSLESGISSAATVPQTETTSTIIQQAATPTVADKASTEEKTKRDTYTADTPSNNTTPKKKKKFFGLF